MARVVFVAVVITAEDRHGRTSEWLIVGHDEAIVNDEINRGGN
jgi:hypothetical protein